MRISDLSSDVCSSDLHAQRAAVDIDGVVARGERVEMAGDEIGQIGQRRRGLHLELGVRDRARHVLADVGEHPLEQRARLGLRSEEQTSELQSLMRTTYAVFFLQKKKNIIQQQN